MRKSISEVYGLSERERMYDQIGTPKFEEIINARTTSIHSISVDTNSYGEFLFVTVNRRVDGADYPVTFYGLGYHDHRETYMLDIWRWYPTSLFGRYRDNKIPKPEARKLIAQRRAELAPYAKVRKPKSERAQLYTLIATLTDDDAAITELEDRGL